MTSAGDELILIGVIARPHGLRGEVAVNSETDFADRRFAAGSVVLAGPSGARPLRIERLRFHQRRPLVLFEGVHTVEQARQLAGERLWVRASEREVLPAGQYYQSDLVGCQVEDADGRAIGTVVRVEESGTPVLVVSGTGAMAGSEVLVPLADEICREIDIAAKRIVIVPPEGLLDLNA
jgi:16S rRNA processing protein RimM